MNVAVTAATLCADDRFAGNVDSSSAESLAAPRLYEQLNKCENTSDWFTISLSQDQEFEAFIRHDASRADLDLKLYREDPNSAGSLIEEATATSTDDDESLTYTPPADDTYYLEVFSKGTARNTYDLLLYRDVGGTADVIDDGIDGPADRSCPDAFEDNDSRPGEVAAVPAGAYNNLLMCDNDRDYYSVFVPAGATMDVDLYFSNAEHNIDVQVYRGTSSTPIAGIGGQSTTDDESISVTNNQSVGATYDIYVFGRDTTDAYYNMEIGLTFSTPCTDDQYGTVSTPNFTRQDAANINTGSYQLQLCEDTEDWYEFSLGSGDNVQANIELQNRLGNIDLELHDSSGVVVASTTDENTEEIDYTATSSDTYQLRVLPRQGVFLRNAYDLWLAIDGSTPTAPYCPDAFERNDEADAASTLDFAQESQRTDLIMCSTEQDWYSVSLNANVTYDLKALLRPLQYFRPRRRGQR